MVAVLFSAEILFAINLVRPIPSMKQPALVIRADHLGWQGAMDVRVMKSAVVVVFGAIVLVRKKNVRFELGARELGSSFYLKKGKQANKKTNRS